MSSAVVQSPQSEVRRGSARPDARWIVRRRHLRPVPSRSDRSPVIAAVPSSWTAAARPSIPWASEAHLEEVPMVPGTN